MPAAEPTKIEIGHLYDVPSKLGGTFIVQALAVGATGLVDCRIYMPRNPDWHGYLVTAAVREMVSLRQAPPPANWVKSLRKRVA